MPQDHMRGGVLGTGGLELVYENGEPTIIARDGPDDRQPCHIGSIYEGPRGTVEVMSEDGDIDYRFPKGTTPREVLMFLAGEERGGEIEKFRARDRAAHTPANANAREVTPAAPSLAERAALREPETSRATVTDPLGLREWRETSYRAEPIVLEPGQRPGGYGTGLRVGPDDDRGR